MNASRTAHPAPAAHVSGIGRRQFVALGAAASTVLLAALPTLGTGATLALAADGAEKLAQSYTPGAYTAAENGRKGPVGVEVTFSADAIEAIEVVESHETPRIAQAAFDLIPPAVIECQSLDVDAATGASLTSAALLGAIADCVEQAGGDAAALQKVPGPAKSTVTEELDADVLVIGCGSAGMVCAMECAMQGAKVAVMERCAYIGGNALVCGGVLDYFSAPDELRAQVNDGYRSFFEQMLTTAVAEFEVPQEVADLVREQWDAYYADGRTSLFTSAEWEYVYGLVVTDDGVFDADEYEGVQEYAAENDAMIEWLNQTDIEWQQLTNAGGYPWPTCTRPVAGECGAGYFMALEDYVTGNNLPIDFLMATRATELVMEDGAAAGAKGVCADGTTYVVHAPKVILATGGFSGSPELLRRFGAEWDFEGMDFIPSDNAYGHDGDGLALAACANAKVPEDKSVFVQITPFSNGRDFALESVVGDTGDALYVNAEAVRFVDECQGRNYVTRAEMAQTGQSCWLISDARSCGFENGYNWFGIEESTIMETGKCYRADTLAELAELAGLDAATLEKTVADFNGYVADGYDPDFGRTLFDELSNVVEPPFYACPCHWTVHITDGLVIVDENSAVLDADDAPIPGLYAIGELNSNSGITNMAEGIRVAEAIMAA